MPDEVAIENICRVCLRSDPEFRLLFEVTEGEQTFAEILSECTKYQVTTSDELPQQICKTCTLSALNAIKFKRKCEESYCQLVARLKLSSDCKDIKFKPMERIENYAQTEETTLYPCERCEDKFFNYDDLKTHRKEHKGNALVCRFCEKPFNRVGYLRAHIAVFHPETRYHHSTFCHICKRQFTLRDHLRRHLSVVHKIVDLNSENTIDDKEDYDTDLNFQEDASIFEDDNNTNSENTEDNYILGLINHIESDEDDNKPLAAFQYSEKSNHSFSESAIEQVFVNECVEKEPTTKQKGKKNEKIRKPTKRDNPIDKSQAKKLFPDEQDHTFSCTMCTMVFKRAVLLRMHMNTRHVSNEKMHCKQCDKTFTHSSQYERHKENKHNERTHKCSICDKTFTTNIYLQRHIAIHKRKRYVCKECTQSYVTKEELTAHMKAEGHDKPLLCPECGLRCKTSNILMVHMRRHKGEKPFKCKFCSKGFPRVDDLRIHEKYHTGEKSHFCETCGKGFQRKYNLTIHLRVHTGEKPYKCPHCPQAFAQGNDLKAHIRRHTGERFRCELCGAAFLQGYQIRQHKLSEHGIREDPPTQRVAKFTSTEAQELQIKQNLQKDLTQPVNEKQLDENDIKIVLDSLPVDVNEVVSSASDVVCSLDVSDFSNIQF